MLEQTPTFTISIAAGCMVFICSPELTELLEAFNFICLFVLQM